MRVISILIFNCLILFSCSDDKPKRKGFNVNYSSPEEATEGKNGLNLDSLELMSRPNRVLILGEKQHRLIPIYLLNTKLHRGDTSYYTGSNNFHFSYLDIGNNKENNWNNNFMPGFEAMYGYNLINVEYHNVESKETHSLFKTPVLIKTIYYPTASKDTLNGVAIKRNFIMVSAYNEDTNKDGFLNTDDLRRFFLFDIQGKLVSQLIPHEYSVQSSQYDAANDYMYVYAVLDENQNGHHDPTEKVDVFWIDLNNPSNKGLIKSN
jgi:hypothetical protein